VWTTRRLLTAFGAGGIGGLVCDQIHVQGHVLAYPRAVLLGQDFWVAPNFGAGTLLMLAGSAAFARPIADAPAPPRRIAIDAAWFVAAYLASSIFAAHVAPLLAAYVVTFLARTLPRPRAALRVAHGLALAAGGVAWEAGLSALHLFHYTHPDVLGVAAWLPGLYLAGAPLALDIASWLVARAPA
jgi:hypothetical protein